MRELVIKTKTENNAKEIVLLEHGEICEYKKEERNLVGNIYAARIIDCVENLEASFADIGVEKNGFVKGVMLPSNSMLMVQVQSAEHHDKGVSLSSIISLAGIYCVLIINPKKKKKEVRISRNITNEERSVELLNVGYKALSQVEETGVRVILRTDTEDALNDDIEFEILELYDEYMRLKGLFKAAENNPKLLKENDDTVTEILRRYPLSTFKKIYTDDAKLSLMLSKAYKSVEVKLTGVNKSDYDIFDILNISNKLVQLSGRKVWLKSGAYILIEPTETMTVIDVNSGKYKEVNNQEKEEAIFLINKEAATEIMRQLRFRNFGGIIICDFIDMMSEDFQTELLEYMRGLARDDFEHPRVIDITKLGLVEITRKRS